jgi:hypothetical protein
MWMIRILTSMTRALCLIGSVAAIPAIGCTGEHPVLTIEYVFPSTSTSNHYSVDAIVDVKNGVKFQPDENGVARLVVPQSGKVLIADDQLFQKWHRSSIRIGDTLYGNSEVEVVTATAIPGRKITKVGNNKSVSISTLDGTKHSIELRVTVPDR